VGFGVAGVAQDAKDREDMPDGAKRCVGHKEMLPGMCLQLRDVY